MQIRILGAICMIAGCGGFGYLMASHHKRKIRLLKKLIDILETMECELRYRCTPLPQLCRIAARQNRDPVENIFSMLADELDAQISPDVERCMAVVLQKKDDLDEPIRQILENMSVNLGHFDLEGQLQGIAHSKASCHDWLVHLEYNQDNRMRSYQTLGLCAGAALAILFV